VECHADLRREMSIGPDMKWIAILVMSLALPGWIAGATAAPRKGESVKSRHHSHEARHGGFYLHSGSTGYRDRASISRDYVPPRGKCVAWFLSRLPGC
jgi:hypothetical protein